MFVTWRLAGTLPQVPAEVLRRDPHPGKLFLAQDRCLDSTPPQPRSPGIAAPGDAIGYPAMAEERYRGTGQPGLGEDREAFWQREYFDHWIRSEKELASVVAYVEANPVKAGLVSSAADWPWSSARETPAARPPALPETVQDFGKM